MPILKIFNCLFQMQTHLANVAKTVGELEEQVRQKNALRVWITQQRALCAEWNSRPAKLRSEAAQAELQAMNELLANVDERRTRALTELSIHEDDRDIEEGLNKLEAELTDAIARKQAAQDLIQKYRSQVQDIQTWFDSLTKKIDVLEKGSGLAINQKISNLKDITADFESQGPEKLTEMKKLGDQVMDSVSNLDSQQIEEQIKSVERRYADISKKLQRKAQVLDMTAQGIEATKREIEENREWIEQKKQQMKMPELLGFESKQAEERLLALKVIVLSASHLLYSLNYIYVIYNNKIIILPILISGYAERSGWKAVDHRHAGEESREYAERIGNRRAAAVGSRHEEFARRAG